MKTQDKALEKAKKLCMSEKVINILKRKYPCGVYSKLMHFLQDWDNDNDCVLSEDVVTAYIDKVVECSKLFSCSNLLSFAFYNYKNMDKVSIIVNKINKETSQLYNSMFCFGSVFTEFYIDDNIFINVLDKIESFFFANKRAHIEILCAEIASLYWNLIKLERYSESDIYISVYEKKMLQNQGNKENPGYASYLDFIRTAVEYNIPANEALQLCDDGWYNASNLLNKLYEKRLFMFSNVCPYNECHTVPSIYFSEKNGLIIDKAKELGCDLRLDIQCVTCEYIYKSGALFVTFHKYRAVDMLSENENDIKLYGANEKDELKLIIAINGNVLQRLKCRNADRWIPLSFKKLAKFHVQDIPFMNNFINCFKEYGKYFGNHLLGDCMEYVKKGMFAPPVSYNDVMKTQSFKELFVNRYSPAIKNWNRNDINIMYATSKICRYVTTESVNMVLNFTNEEFFYNNVKHDSFIVRKNAVYKNGVYDFLTMWLENTFLGNENKLTEVKAYLLIHDMVDQDENVKKWVKGIINDYVRMCLKSKIKVQLKMTSLSKLLRYHENLVLKSRNKNIPMIKIPKSSKFSKLRKLLPEDFEWIKSKRRLLAEAVMQQHCVASYADYINEDICAIYSFMYKPEGKRYTLEFRVNERNEYEIIQMQSKCNHGHSSEAYAYVQSFLQK